MPLKVPFNRPFIGGNEIEYVKNAINSGRISGDGPFAKQVELLIEQQLEVEKVLLTTSCTHALEMAAILLDLEPGDEVIVPSFTFTSSALAFVMHGATPIFADIRPDTLNLDETKLESLITERTRAIVAVHYAGIACEMTDIMELAERYSLVVIEDNAHGLYGKYNDQYLGSIGHLAVQSFHETKNITCGEGGALIINDRKYIKRAEIVREKGTNRSAFFRGEIEKYTWVDKGSSFVMADILAAMLFAQISECENIQEKRKKSWYFYNNSLLDWSKSNNVSLPYVPVHCAQSYHMYYMLLPSADSRTKFQKYLDSCDINAVIHYLPLNSSIMGKRLGGYNGQCLTTEDICNRIIRLPFFTDITLPEQDYVVSNIKKFKI